MAITHLKEIDGTVMLPLSAEMLQALNIQVDSPVSVDVAEGQLVIHAEAKASGRRIPRYKLSDLLAEWEQMPRNEEEDRLWVNAPRVGRELL